MGILKTIEELGFQVKHIDRLVKAPWNFKKDDEEKRQTLKNQIERNGQLQNLIVREIEEGKFEIANGNFVYDAIKDLGIKFVVVKNLGKVTQVQAQRIAVETDQIKFETDFIKLAKVIKDINLEFDLDELETTMPFTKEELEEFTEMSGFDWDQYQGTGDDLGGKEPQGKAITCPKCGHKFEPGADA